MDGLGLLLKKMAGQIMPLHIDRLLLERRGFIRHAVPEFEHKWSLFNQASNSMSRLEDGADDVAV